MRYVIPIFAACLLLSACSKDIVAEDFAAKTPVFAPDAFFTGHTQSWGMIETAGGMPDEGFHSDAHGHKDADGALSLIQNFAFDGGKTTERHWRFTKIDEHHFEGTANDVVGTAHGEAYGSIFHWTYTLALSPGNSLKDVYMDQWMYLQDDGSMVNRAAIRKLGLTVAMVTEHFRRLPD